MKNFKFLFLFLLAFLFLSACTKSYTVSFVTNNDEVIDAKVFEKDDDLPLLTKEGYDFGGWFKDSGFNTEFKEIDEVKEDFTLYAKWNIKKYEVKFVDGSKELSKVTVEHGKAATAPATPTKEGYEFKEWSIPFTNVTKNLVVYAVFEMDTFEVKFMNGTEQIGETQVIDYGSAATAPADPVKEGYEFTGWDKEFDVVKADLVVNAQFTKLEYTVKFLGKNGDLLSEQKIEYGVSATAPASPTIDGYTFTGWDKVYSSVKENLTVRAVYTAIEYDIEYYEGTTKLTLTPAKYTIEDAITYPEYVKEGYLFVGWYDNADFNGDKLTGLLKGRTDKVTLYAKTLDSSQKSDIVYELNGGLWGWTVADVTTPKSGIDAVSNLPEIFMQDFYTYLKDNNLLSDTVIDAGLRKTTWADFSKSYTDPRAIYNWAANKEYGGLGADVAGYSQFFLESGTGEANGKITTLVGGFFGADGYKEKYATLAQHLAYLLNDRYTNTNLLWVGGSNESLAGFVFDGYFYGTQGLLASGTAARDNRHNALRAVIPTPDKGYVYEGTAVKEYTYDFLKDSMITGTEAVLSIPSREGYFFAGWYVNAEFSGERVYKISEGSTPVAKYYAKWEAVA